tara:strand:- start:235 stop:648 length:414 start_codon:yes stop_codon:yes gene_type:complete
MTEFLNNNDLPKMVRQIGEDKWNLGLAYKNQQNYDDLLIEYKPVYDWVDVPEDLERKPPFVGCWAWAIISLYDRYIKKTYKLTAYIEDENAFKLWCSMIQSQSNPFIGEYLMEKRVNKLMTDYLLRSRDTWKNLKPF